MTQLIQVVDNFCPQIDEVRESAIQAGFGSWRPPTAAVGSGVYEGMCFWGRHSYMLKALAEATGVIPFVNNMFFRVTNTDTEKAYVHSDRMWGTKTCVAYLSQHEEDSGTGFFRHRETGLIEMPTFEEQKKMRIFDLLKKDMTEGGENEWQQLDYVRGLYNRAVIFHAPLFHSRWPKTGIGNTSENGRMVWCAHMNTLLPGGGF